MNRNEKLKKLIDDARRLEEFSWLSPFQIEMTRFVAKSSNKSLPLESIKDTYSFRGKLNRERGNPIKGFETLLKNLDVTKTENVVIHPIVDRYGFEYNIFTDPEIKVLLGVLRFRHPGVRKAPILKSSL